MVAEGAGGQVLDVARLAVGRELSFHVPLPPYADEAALLGRKPSLQHLRNIVVPRVSSKWKTIGLNLNIKDCRLSAIEKSKHYQTDACCTEMFSMWLSLAPHTGSLPLTWRSVLSAIEKAERVTSEELLAELKRSVEASLPQEPTQQVCRDQAVTGVV